MGQMPKAAVQVVCEGRKVDDDAGANRTARFSRLFMESKTDVNAARMWCKNDGVN